ncbi:MAG: hypothetical protein Q9191_004291 [Dirinaria sp. TL-2023a]
MATDQSTENPKHFNITAITAKDGTSRIECWRLTAPFEHSHSPGSSGPTFQRISLGKVQNASYAIIPPKHDSGLHNAPHVHLGDPPEPSSSIFRSTIELLLRHEQLPWRNSGRRSLTSVASLISKSFEITQSGKLEAPLFSSGTDFHRKVFEKHETERYGIPLQIVLSPTSASTRLRYDDLAKNHRCGRQALRYIIRNTTLPPRARAQAQLKLSQMHCYTRPTQIRNRCIEGGKGRGVLSDFRMARVSGDRWSRAHRLQDTVSIPNGGIGGKYTGP